jgi:hypothetical protein
LNDAVQSQHDDQKIAMGLFIGGGALVVSAVVTWLAWPRAASAEPQPPAAAIVPIPGGAAASFSGTF